MALSATEKHEMRTWGLDVNAISWPDGTKPPPWVKVRVDTRRQDGNGRSHACQSVSWNPSCQFFTQPLPTSELFESFTLTRSLDVSPCCRSARANCRRSCLKTGISSSSGKLRRGSNRSLSPLPLSASPRPSGTRRTSGRTRNWGSEPPERSRSLSRNCGRRHLPGFHVVVSAGGNLLDVARVYSRRFSSPV